MEPLIRLRTLASQLNEHELQNLIQTIVTTYGTEKILTVIFNHFVTKYYQNNKHNDDVYDIIAMISSIIHSRKKNKDHAINDTVDNNMKSEVINKVKSKLLIDSIPFEMIGECASYLPSNDYLHFAKCNRKIYIACNSPSTLQRLLLFEHDDYPVDFNRFPSLKTLGITIAIFNAITFEPKPKTFHDLNQLVVHNILDYDHKEIDTFMNNKYIDFRNIKRVQCLQFGNEVFLYDFDTFCNFISSFQNMRTFSVDNVYLTQFNENNAIMLPYLRMIEVKPTVNRCVNLLRNKLLGMYSKQIESVIYSESQMDIDVVCFPDLKEIFVIDPNIESLCVIIKNAAILERISVEIPPSSRRLFDETKIKDIIDTLFTMNRALQFVLFHGDYGQILKIIGYMEMAMYSTMSVIWDSITLVFSIHGVMHDAEIEKIKVCTFRIIHALERAGISDFMVGVHVDTLETSIAFGDNMDKLKDKHLIFIFNDSKSIIISNKNCKINGYSSKWLNTL